MKAAGSSIIFARRWYYLLAGNAAELALMMTAALLGLPLPLLPLHLRWINLATDGLPALALVMDPADPDALRRPPRRPDEPLLGRAEWISIAWTGALQTAVVLAVYLWALEARGLDEARNLAFTVLVFGELFRAFAARHPTRLFWEVGALTNIRLLVVVLVSAALQIAIHHIPAARSLFHVSTLSMADCIMSVLLGLIPVTMLELVKLGRRIAGARPDIRSPPSCTKSKKHHPSIRSSRTRPADRRDKPTKSGPTTRSTSGFIGGSRPSMTWSRTPSRDCGGRSPNSRVSARA